MRPADPFPRTPPLAKIGLRSMIYKSMNQFCTSTLVILAVASAGVAVAGETEPASQSAAVDSRCFEMRTYYAAPGKLEALNARFRDHTCALFKKHGMEVIGFSMPVDQEQGAGHKLVYLLAHKSREAARASFAEFANDPEWKKARTESEVNGKLVTKVESVFMSATDYSPMK